MGLDKFRNGKMTKDNGYTNTDVVFNDTKRYKKKRYNLDTMEMNLVKMIGAKRVTE